MFLDFLKRRADVPAMFIWNLRDEPLYRQWLLMGFASSCLGTAFILSLFATLSLPISQSMYLLELSGYGTGVVRLGVWGYCRSLTSSESKGKALYSCLKSDPRYTYGFALAEDLHVDVVDDSVSSMLLSIAFIQPAACAIVLAAFTISICVFFKEQCWSRIYHSITMIIIILSLVATALAYGLTEGYVHYVRQGVTSTPHRQAVDISRGFVMSSFLGSMILASISLSSWMAAMTLRPRRPTVWHCRTFQEADYRTHIKLQNLH